MRSLCAANWKLHKTPQETEIFIKALLEDKVINDNVEVLIFPQNFSAQKCAELLKNQNQVTWGAQNCYFENKGAFTGENSPKILKQMGAKYVLIGHSERRHIFNENLELINKKMKTCLEVGLVPLLCIGEKKGEDFKKVLKEQIVTSIKNIDNKNNIVIAYEPVWAIGTGLSISKESLSKVNLYIKEVLKSISKTVTVLYGGSVNVQNASELASLDSVDGFLIGGLSLKLDSFCPIIHKLHEVKSK